MPARNLVNQFELMRKLPFSVNSGLVLLIAFTLLSHAGCSKFAGPAHSNFLNRTNDLGWQTDPDLPSNNFESAARYIADAKVESEEAIAQSGEDAASDLARIVNSSQVMDDIAETNPIRLTANSANSDFSNMAPPIIDQSESSNCDHEFECDCHKRKQPPKLASVKPIDPATLIPVNEPLGEPVNEPANNFVVSDPNQVTPSKNVSPPLAVARQPLSPLTPLMFDEETRQVDLDHQAIKQNELRALALRAVSDADLVQAGFDSPVANEQAFDVEPSPSFVDSSTSLANESAFVGGPAEPLAEMEPLRQLPAPVVESVKNQSIKIVATVSNETPPFAEPPVAEMVEIDQFSNSEPQPATVEIVEPVFNPSEDEFYELLQSYADSQREQVYTGQLTAHQVETEPQPVAIETPEVVEPASYAGAFEPMTNGFVTQSTPPVADMSIETADAIVSESDAVVYGDLSDDACKQLFEKQPSQPCSGNCLGCQQGFCQSAKCQTETAPCEKAEFATEEFVSEEINQAQPVDTTAVENGFAAASHVAEVPEAKFEVPAIEMTEMPLEIELPENEFVPFAPVEPSDADVSTESETTPIKPEPSDFTMEAVDLPIINREPEPKIIHTVEIVDNTVPWDVQIQQAIDKVQGRIESETDELGRNGLEVNLRLLQMLKRQMADVEDKRPSLSNQERAYWQHQLDAINAMLESGPNATDQARHATTLSTLKHLRKAVERLESIANLGVTNPAFCREVSGYGKFRPFETTSFKTDQKMLVYCEIENYKSILKTANLDSRYHTKLRGSYAIYDSQGRAVQQAEYPVVEDVVRNRRRDFYMYFPVQLNKLDAGGYRMELMIEDLNGNKSASLPPMEFQVQ